MISEVLSSIENVSIYPIVTLLIFVAAFGGVVVWTLKIRKQEIIHMSRLPLDDSPQETTQGEPDNA